MSKIGRNSPCPCGSGKKYKRCCLAHDETCRTQPQEQADAKALAVGWLKEHHGEAVKNALAHSFPSDREWKEIATMPAGIQTAVDCCLDEWLIADAVLCVNNERMQAGDLLLGPDGPRFSAEGRQYIEELAASELSLYEVLEVRGDKGIILRDMLRQNAPPVFMQQKKETETLVIWDTLGARILRRHGTYTLGDGLCPLARGHAAGLADTLRKAMQREARKKRPKATAAEITSTGIIAAWFSAVTTSSGSRAQGRADAGGAWLEDTADAFLAHTGRESAEIHKNRMDRAPSPPDAPLPKKRKGRMTPEIRQSNQSGHMARNYEEWLVTPLPALNGKTPLQAARLKTYRPKVVELLKCIERGEAHISRKLGLPVFDVGFLWERLGLARPCVSQASP